LPGVRWGSMIRYRFAIALFAVILAGAAQAQDLRPLCPDRPGLGTPACTVDPGHAMVEMGGIDWTLDKDPSQRSDTLIAGDLLVRYGLDAHTEVQAGWTAFGSVRVRDRLAGGVSRRSGTGDVLLAIRRNLAHPDGEHVSVGVMPFATLPTGGTAIGAGDWAAGLIVPLSFSLDDRFSLALSPEVDAAVDEDRHGRHLAYGGVIGLSAALTDAVTSTLEFQEVRDRDPSGHATHALTSLSLAWQPRKQLQLDIGAVAGVNAASPDVELYVGVARRF
jgi:hypothetical protein